MSRKAQAPKREVLADPIYNSKQVTKLINQIMLDGKKGVAEHIVYSAFDIVAEKTGNEAIDVFEEALKNIMPVLEVKARRVGGANYQVPIEVCLGDSSWWERRLSTSSTTNSWCSISMLLAKSPILLG